MPFGRSDTQQFRLQFKTKWENFQTRVNYSGKWLKCVNRELGHGRSVREPPLVWECVRAVSPCLADRFELTQLNRFRLLRIMAHCQINQKHTEGSFVILNWTLCKILIKSPYWRNEARDKWHGECAPGISPTVSWAVLQTRPGIDHWQRAKHVDCKFIASQIPANK